MNKRLIKDIFEPNISTYITLVELQNSTIGNSIAILVAVTSSGILKAKQKLGITFNSDKLGGIDFTKISKLTMCSA
jgi:hypothetical protein